MTTKCVKCQIELSPEWIWKKRKFCSECFEKEKAFTQEIREFRNETLQQLRNTVSHSRKGKYRKQPWGFHIEADKKYNTSYIPKAKLLNLT